jgi:K(+)-stimulated pyrophosphate-energized sodium pump
MTPLLASNFLLTNGITLSLVIAGLGVLFALVLIRIVASAPSGNEAMQKVAASIQEGAKAYLGRQVMTISVIAGIIFVLLLVWKRSWPTPVGFLVGAFFSLLAGYIGMRVAVLANVRTTEAAEKSMQKALRVAFNGGAVTGLLVVGLALLSVGFYFFLVGGIERPEEALQSLIGLALGASLISVFARLGGGIYTKAADVGADLVGKIEVHLSEDDPRNPATIADNVGDNVGDCAGMAADVFETYAVTLIGALLIATLQLEGNVAALVFPFVLGGISIVTSVLGIIYVNVRSSGEPGRVLSEGVIISALVSAVLFYPATMQLFPESVVISGTTFSRRRGASDRRVVHYLT